MNVHGETSESKRGRVDRMEEQPELRLLAEECGEHTNSLVPLSQGDAEINRAIAAYQDRLEGWVLRTGNGYALDLGSWVRRLRDWADDLWITLIPMTGEMIKKRCLFLCFASSDPRRVLGHYVPDRNDSGLRWEISVSPRHLVTRSEVQVASVLLHEMLHMIEHEAGKAPRSRNNYHSSWFRNTAHYLGIPCTRYGAEQSLRDPSPFMDWARGRGMKEDPELQAETMEPCRRYRDTWICACPREEGKACSVEVARGSTIKAKCLRCNQTFHRRDRAGGER